MNATAKLHAKRAQLKAQRTGRTQELQKSQDPTSSLMSRLLAIQQMKGKGNKQRELLSFLRDMARGPQRSLLPMMRQVIGETQFQLLLGMLRQEDPETYAAFVGAESAAIDPVLANLPQNPTVPPGLLEDLPLPEDPMTEVPPGLLDDLPLPDEPQSS